jgi:hypothetical protein
MQSHGKRGPGFLPANSLAPDLDPIPRNTLGYYGLVDTPVKDKDLIREAPAAALQVRGANKRGVKMTSSGVFSADLVEDTSEQPSVEDQIFDSQNPIAWSQ